MQNLPQRVVERLKKMAPDAQSHPDPDLLTAFAERALPGQERSQIIDHLARCGDCREILAIAALAAESQAQHEVAPALRRIPWFSRPALRWSALAAGVLIVASAGILQYGHLRQTTVASNLIPNEEHASPVASPSASLPQEQEKARRDLLSETHNPPPYAKKTGLRRTPNLAPRRAEQSDSALGSAQPSASAEKVAASFAPRDVPGEHRPLTDGSAELQTQLAQNQPLFPGQNGNQDVVKAKNPVPTPSETTAMGAIPFQPQAGDLRWAINGGVLQRSLDEGRSWQNVNPATDSATEFLAIAVSGPEVWVGGSSARLYHSSDAGTHWTRTMPSSGGATLTGNVIGIQFNDAVHGKIITSTSESWTTSDAGQTWSKQQ
jgi:hypothetical protein